MPRRRNRARPMTARLRRVRESLDYPVERLARDLAEDGYVAEQVDDGTIQLRGDTVEAWDPPVRLAFTDEELRSHLLSMDDARDVFPDVDAVQAAYQLFHVHLDEELATATMPGSRITMGPRGLDVDPARVPQPWPELDSDGDYAWVADPPEGLAGKLEFLSPEQYEARYRAHRGGGPDVSQRSAPRRPT